MSNFSGLMHVKGVLERERVFKFGFNVDFVAKIRQICCAWQGGGVSLQNSA